MSEHSTIEWTDATWNPVTGCRQIPGPHGGPSGCDHCYAKYLNDRRQTRNPKSVRYGLPFERVLCHDNRLDLPLRWRKPRRIFVNSLSDLFHADVPDTFIEQVFQRMLAASQHTYQILTKRPERMRRVVPAALAKLGHTPVCPTHIWLGASISTNADAQRANDLRATPASVRFLSVEPLLGPVDAVDFAHIDLLIVGGESGPNARPMHTQWARDVRDRCVRERRAFFFKQHGRYAPVSAVWGGIPLLLERNPNLILLDMTGHTWTGDDMRAGTPIPGQGHYALLEAVGKHRAGRVLDGRTWNESPTASVSRTAR